LAKFRFGSSLPSVVCRRAHALFMLFVFVFVYSGAQYVSTIWVSWQVSYKRQELLTIREHLHSPPVLGGSVFIIFFCVLFFFVMCVMCEILPIFMDLVLYYLFGILYFFQRLKNKGNSYNDLYDIFNKVIIVNVMCVKCFKTS
jgi:hypothetical protein